MVVHVASLPITVGVGGFLVRDGRLLVVRKTYGPSKGLWTIPSGYVEPGESIVAAVEREMKEETNISGRAGAILAVRNRVIETANDTFLIFSMSYLEGTPQPDRNEVSDASFVPLAELRASPDVAPFTKAIIPRLLDARGLHLDGYAPPVDPSGPRPYLLFV